MSMQSINLTQLGALHTAQDVHDLFRRLGYPVETPDAFFGDDLDALELDPADRANVVRAYIVSRLDMHTVYLYEVNDLRTARLRSLAWNALQRGTGLLIVTTPAERGAYREIVFVDPRFAGKPTKGSVRVNKLRVITAEPTRHDLDTLNAIHAHRRTGQQVYDAQGAAFNVTTVTKRFYDEYRRHYERAKAAIQKANPGVRDFYDADKLHAFTQRLLGRLMFLYFLQRKGWLGGRARFLTEQYLSVQRRHASETHDGETYYYYRDVLEPLFFQTMNTKRPGDITIWEGIRIPYLNGGLFDESRDPAGPILIPDSLFDPNDVDGLLGFFNRYNFTVADDTPLEQDVAVDPEMLGKVFENLLEERDRGQSGSFYTPRSIVAYMCQEALAGYLQESAGIPYETTRALFDPDADASLTPDEATRIDAALDTLTVLDPAVGSGSFLIGMMNEILRLRHATYATLNPAPAETEPGVRATTPLPSGEGPGVRAEPPPKTVSDWKEAIIRDTLYGVDIKPEAIEIAQLRLWLALVVDQTLEQAHPLPNLDYKLMAGNSLIETIDGEPVLTESAAALLNAGVMPVQPGLGLFETDRERRRLDELRRAYFSASPEQRKRLKPDILNQERRIIATALREKAETQEQIINQIGKRAAQTGGKLKTSDERKLKAASEKLARLTALQEALDKPDYVPPFFLYRLHFSEVFEKKGGFDIVVANPPYVRGELLGAVKDEFKVTPIYRDVYAGTADLYVYFYARGYHLLRPGGQLAYITSNKYLRSRYGRGLRKFLAEQIALRALIDFGDLPVFEAAAYPCIVIGEKRPALTLSALTLNPSPEGEGLKSPRLEGEGLKGVRLEGEGLESPRLEGEGLEGAGLKEEGLKGARLEGEGLESAGLKEEGLKSARLEGEGPEGARLEGEGLEGAGLKEEGLKGARLEGERLEGAGLEKRTDGTYRQMASRAMVGIARDLRRRETSAEQVLWACLRDRRLGNLKFRRQHPVPQTNYVVDFFCYEHRLVIELDGGIHTRQVEADRARQQALEALGLRVLRFPNDMVFHDLPSVLTTILQTALTSPLPSGEGPGVRATPLSGEGPRVRATPLSGEGPGVRATSITSMDELENLHAALASGVTLRQTDLGEGEWQIGDAATRRVFARIRAAGVPLGEYVGGRIYYGIKTGLNEAFVIDAAKRAELIAADPRSAEIIKPWLRGRDIKRWRVEPAGLYVIFARQGIDIEAYPAIKAHLEQFRAQLTPGIPGGRAPGNYKWYELQSTIAYYAEFEKPKIIYPDIAENLRFSIDITGYYLSNTTYMISKNDSFLLGLLNSNIIQFFYDGLSSQIRGGYYRFFTQYISQLPIPTPSAALRERIAALARACTEAALTPGPSPSGAEFRVRVRALEAELNALVYQAYGLDEDDIRVIEAAVGGRSGVESAEVETDESEERS